MKKRYCLIIVDKQCSIKVQVGVYILQFTFFSQLCVLFQLNNEILINILFVVCTLCRQFSFALMNYYISFFRYALVYVSHSNLIDRLLINILMCMLINKEIRKFIFILLIYENAIPLIVQNDIQELLDWKTLKKYYRNRLPYFQVFKLK